MAMTMLGNTSKYYYNHLLLKNPFALLSQHLQQLLLSLSIGKRFKYESEE